MADPYNYQDLLRQYRQQGSQPANRPGNYTQNAMQQNAQSQQLSPLATTQPSTLGSSYGGQQPGSAVNSMVDGAMQQYRQLQQRGGQPSPGSAYGGQQQAQPVNRSAQMYVERVMGSRQPQQQPSQPERGLLGNALSLGGNLYNASAGLAQRASTAALTPAAALADGAYRGVAKLAGGNPDDLAQGGFPAQTFLGRLSNHADQTIGNSVDNAQAAGRGILGVQKAQDSPQVAQQPYQGPILDPRELIQQGVRNGGVGSAQAQAQAQPANVAYGVQNAIGANRETGQDQLTVLGNGATVSTGRNAQGNPSFSDLNDSQRQYLAQNPNISNGAQQLLARAMPSYSGSGVSGRSNELQSVSPGVQAGGQDSRSQIQDTTRQIMDAARRMNGGVTVVRDTKGPYGEMLADAQNRRNQQSAVNQILSAVGLGDRASANQANQAMANRRLGIDERQARLNEMSAGPLAALNDSLAQALANNDPRAAMQIAAQLNQLTGKGANQRPNIVNIPSADGLTTTPAVYAGNGQAIPITLRTQQQAEQAALEEQQRRVSRPNANA